MRRGGFWASVHGSGGVGGAEAEGQAIAGWRCMVFECVGKLAQQANAIAPDARVVERARDRRLGRGQRVEEGSFIFDHESEIAIAGAAGELHEYGTARLAGIAVADDVRENFLEAKIHGELRVIG